MYFQNYNPHGWGKGNKQWERLTVDVAYPNFHPDKIAWKIAAWWTLRLKSTFTMSSHLRCLPQYVFCVRIRQVELQLTVSTILFPLYVLLTHIMPCRCRCRASLHSQHTKEFISIEWHVRALHILALKHWFQLLVPVVHLAPETDTTTRPVLRQPFETQAPEKYDSIWNTLCRKH